LPISGNVEFDDFWDDIEKIDFYQNQVMPQDEIKMNTLDIEIDI
jgi:hypothetical protein